MSAASVDVEGALVYRVLVVEDHAVIRGVIRLACDHAFGLEVVGEVGSGEEALEAILADPPDVIALDLVLPGPLQGLDVVRRVRAEGLPTRILVLTGLTDERTLFEMLDNGLEAIGSRLRGQIAWSCPIDNRQYSQSRYCNEASNFRFICILDHRLYRISPSICL